MATHSDDVARAARQVLALASSRPATLGGARLICIDGPAGSGKTTLAAAIAAQEPAAVVLATDAMLEGWAGLAGLGATIADLLADLASARPARWRRWDWHADGWADTEPVPSSPLLVLEGVGSWARRYRHLVTALVWVEAPREIRLARWLARDGEAQRPYWEAWLRDEAATHEREGTRDAADVVVRT